MTAHVLAHQADGPGKARKSPLIGMGSRAVKMGVYDFNYGTDVYVANGTDISAIWDDFPGGVNFIGIEQQDTNTAADQRKFAIDYTNKKILVYTAVNTEDTGNDLGVVTLRLLVVGSA